MNKDSRIYVTGHNGLIGSAILRRLQAEGYTNIRTTSRKGEFAVDLRDWRATRWWFSCTEPEYVFHCAARVGGLAANQADPLGFFLDNMRIEMNVLDAADMFGTKKLMLLGSSCVYPTTAPRPLKEDSLLTGPFEPAVEAYGLAKVAGIRLCQWYRQKRHQNFISVLPCNTFGINDRLDPATSHVVPGMLCRMREAIRTRTPMKIWGDGSAARELLFSDDLAEALLLVMEKYNDPEPINTGSGCEISIANLAKLCKEVTGYPWELEFDPKAMVGTQHKCMDNSKLRALGWAPRTSLVHALKVSYADLTRRLDNQGQN